MFYNKAKIDTDSNPYRYFDKYGNEVHAYDIIRIDEERLEMVYPTEYGTLGTDSTNRAWIREGRAYRCQFGIYPFNIEDMINCEVVAHKNDGVMA